MKLPKLRLTRKSDLALAQSAKVMLDSVTKNADKFPDLTDAVAELQATHTPFADITQKVREAKLAYKALVATKNALRKPMQLAMRKVANGVETLAQGDVQLIHEAGMNPTNDHSPVYMTQVLGLQLTPSIKEGELLARWKPVRRNLMYEVQICKDTDSVPTNWERKLFSSKTRCSLNHDLVSGVKVWVRVRAFGARGYGPWSEAIRRTVP